LGIPQRRIAIARGAAARDKLLAIEGLTTSEVERRLGVDAGASE
jgi:hypothetical protein